MKLSIYFILRFELDLTKKYYGSQISAKNINKLMKIKIIISVNILLIEIDLPELSTYQSIFSKRLNNNGNLKWDIFFDIYGQQQLVHK